MAVQDPQCCGLNGRRKAQKATEG